MFHIRNTLILMQERHYNECLRNRNRKIKTYGIQSIYYGLLVAKSLLLGIGWKNFNSQQTRLHRRHRQHLCIFFTHYSTQKILRLSNWYIHQIMNPLLHRRTESYKDDGTKFIHRRVDIVHGDGNLRPDAPPCWHLSCWARHWWAIEKKWESRSRAIHVETSGCAGWRGSWGKG